MHFPGLAIDWHSSENLIQLAADMTNKSYVIW